MKRLLLLISTLVLLISFSACVDKPLYDVTYPMPVIVEPDEETAYNINGYKDTTVSSQIQNSSSSKSSYQGKYIGNKNSKKLHKTECTYAKNINEENIVIFDNYDEAKNNGYKDCTKCLTE